MANEEEMESFDVSERDLYDAFQPGQRRFRKMTKNQQIYGVFDEDEEENPRSSSSNRQNFSKSSASKDYTAPVDFVKGGIQEGSKKEKIPEKNKLFSYSESEEEEDSSIGFGGRGQTKGKLSQEKEGKKQPRKMFERFNKDSKTPGSGDLGEWEKHTKGIGAKLLFQMGYQPGKGLGKSLQGRSEPVEAQVRKGRGAIGIYGSERKNESAKKQASDDEEEKEYKKNLAHWRKDLVEPSSKKKKVQYLYRTTEEVIEEMSKSGVHRMAREYSEISKAKVIDMTGREQRILQGYSALRTKKTEEPNDTEAVAGIKKDKFQLEKLCYNLDTLVDLCEYEIIQNAKELSYNQDQIVAMEAQMKTMSVEVSKEITRMEMLTAMLGVLEQLEIKQAANELTLDYLWEQIRNLEQSYPEEYVSSDLANVTLTYLIPLMKLRLSTYWRPLDSKSTDEACRLIFQRWRPILEFCNKTQTNSRGGIIRNDSRMDPYHGLLWHAWMPAFRGLVGQWTCKNADPMVDLIESWEQILPNWIMENILDQLILPRIQKEVDSWNPLTDLIPIHAWIHPWLPRLGSKLEIVYPNIRHKMSQALVAWSPSDQSARSVLLPWVPVFSKGSMDAFLIKNILPKLQIAITKWDINPSRQELDVWHWIMNWKDLMPVQSLVQLLVSNFFPKWLQVLVAWLNHHPNYEEIVVWYTGWKALFPPEIAQNPAIQEQFTRALDLMNRSLAVGGQVDFTPPPVPVMTPLVAAPLPTVAETVVPHGFRELVEYRCAQQGILCIPLVNRFQAGRPIFRVGNVLCYFDRQVVFVLVNGVWTPVTAQQLLDMAVL
ncbi:Tuftelin-interacting protein 11 [Daphnia magna]|uniref:Tuftelin-interacting protein 11 n=1 Tax=Daphnia magna TaxID=35525 RepID=A0A164XQ68_9CRUS|nr:Tuftelin-interacting protein 11 [Daphnia magna]